jgi:hypothetical protein
MLQTSRLAEICHNSLNHIIELTIWSRDNRAKQKVTCQIFSINIVSQVTMRSSGTDIVYGCRLLRYLYNLLYFLWLYNDFFIILFYIKIKPYSVRIRFLSCHICVLTSTGFEFTPLMNCRINRLALCQATYTTRTLPLLNNGASIIDVLASLVTTILYLAVI